MPKTKTKKPTRKGSRLGEYYQSLDLEALWEQFAMSFTDNGQRKFPTVYKFIKSKTKDPLKREFLWWILGPKAEEPHKKEFKEFPQFDWEDKREQGFWYSSKSIEDVKSRARSSMSAFDEVKAIGAFNLDEMGRIKVILDQLDREFGGMLQLPNLSAKENDLRLVNYFRLRAVLQGQLHEAQSMYAKTRSVDFAALKDMLAIVGPAMLGQLSGGTGMSPEDEQKLNTVTQLNMMLLNKSLQRGIALPDKDQTEMIKNMNKTITIDRKKVQ